MKCGGKRGEERNSRGKEGRKTESGGEETRGGRVERSQERRVRIFRGMIRERIHG